MNTNEEQIDPTEAEEVVENEAVEPTPVEAEAEQAEPEAEPVKEAAPEEEPVRLQLMRLQADFDNYRKRMARDRISLTQQANKNMLEELLPVIDHYEMGLQTARQHDADGAVVAGFDMVFTQLNNLLTKFGLKEIEAMGLEFNPHVHEAVSHLPSADVEKDFVMVQTRKGYLLGDKLLRPAQVVVSAGAGE